MDDVRFNGRERAGEKRRVFVCRLTDGRVAVIADKTPDESPPDFFPDLGAAKQQIALLVPDIRIPIFQDYELKAVRRQLNELSATPAM